MSDWVKARIYYKDGHQEFYEGPKYNMPGGVNNIVEEYLGNESKIVMSCNTSR